MTETMLVIVRARNLTTLFAVFSTVGGEEDGVGCRMMDEQALAMDGRSSVLGDRRIERFRIGTLAPGGEVPYSMGVALIDVILRS